MPPVSTTIYSVNSADGKTCYFADGKAYDAIDLSSLATSSVSVNVTLAQPISSANVHVDCKIVADSDPMTTHQVTSEPILPITPDGPPPPRFNSFTLVFHSIGALGTNSETLTVGDSGLTISVTSGTSDSASTAPKAVRTRIQTGE